MNDKILELFGEIGIKEVGFCPFEAVRDRLLPCRAAARLPQNAKSVILCLFPYKVREERPQNISRYAAVPDYHMVCGKRLEDVSVRLRAAFPHNRFEWFLDNSPIPEVYAAASAGLGVRGDNGLLIHPRYGSWCFIGEVVTDLPLACRNEPKRCDGCGKCRKSCPKGGELACLSAVSQKKQALSALEAEALRKYGIVWGCDLCAESCPLNQNAALTDIPEFLAGYRDRYERGEDITGRAYEWRGERVVARNEENQSG